MSYKYPFTDGEPTDGAMYVYLGNAQHVMVESIGSGGVGLSLQNENGSGCYVSIPAQCLGALMAALSVVGADGD